MARIVAPDKGVKETDIGRARYTVNKQGIYEVSNPSHIRAMKAEGYFEASLNPISKDDNKRGFTCVECGFEGWFRKCGRCGHETNDQPRESD